MAIPAVNIAPSRRAGATRAAGRVLASVLGSSQGRPGLGARPESATGHDRRARRRAGGRRSSLTSLNPAILASKGCGYARSLTRRVRYSRGAPRMPAVRCRAWPQRIKGELSRPKRCRSTKTTEREMRDL